MLLVCERDGTIRCKAESLFLKAVFWIKNITIVEWDSTPKSIGKCWKKLSFDIIHRLIPQKLNYQIYENIILQNLFNIHRNPFSLLSYYRYLIKEIKIITYKSNVWRPPFHISWKIADLGVPTFCYNCDLKEAIFKGKIPKSLYDGNSKRTRYLFKYTLPHLCVGCIHIRL